MRLLAVDDDPLLLELLVATLEEEGDYQISTAGSGREALRLLGADQKGFDCLLFDIRMPEMDGIELTRKVRELPKYQATPIVMITAMTERHTLDNAFAVGATDYVTKPFEPVELRTRLRIARSVIEERRIANSNVIAIKRLQEKVARALRFGIDEPIQIQDVPGVIDRQSMENYLLKLSRNQIYQITLFGIRVAEIETIYAQSSTEELYYTLTDVADALMSSLGEAKALVTYNGGGTFVMATGRVDAEILNDLQLKVQMAVDEMDLTYDDGSPCKVTIAIGKPAAASIFGSTSIHELVGEAVDSADEAARLALSRGERTIRDAGALPAGQHRAM